MDQADMGAAAEQLREGDGMTGEKGPSAAVTAPALDPLLIQRLHDERTAARSFKVDCWACESAQSALVRDLAAAFESAWEYAADSQAEIAHLRSLLGRARDLLRQGAQEALAELDGSNASTVAMQTGFTLEELDDLGGVAEDDQP